MDLEGSREILPTCEVGWFRLKMMDSAENGLVKVLMTSEKNTAHEEAGL